MIDNNKAKGQNVEQSTNLLSLKRNLCITDFSLKTCWNNYQPFSVHFNSKLSHAEKEIYILQIYKKKHAGINFSNIFCTF